MAFGLVTTAQEVKQETEGEAEVGAVPDRWTPVHGFEQGGPFEPALEKGERAWRKSIDERRMSHPIVASLAV